MDGNFVDDEDIVNNENVVDNENIVNDKNVVCAKKIIDDEDVFVFVNGNAGVKNYIYDIAEDSDKVSEALPGLV